MPTRRIIPCLDVRAGRVVKGVRFEGHRDVGAIEEHTAHYVAAGADELVFYDIAASPEQRSVDLDWVRRVARLIDIPFAVAGGIRTRDQAAAVLDAGADKVSVNSPALERPDLIEELARDFGSQCVVVGVDSLAGADGDYQVRQYTGDPAQSRGAGRRTLDWVREVAARGAGEIVLNCMTRDGVRSGFDVAHTAAVVGSVAVPVIASGGAGAPEHFRDILATGGASGALAATVFHDRLIAIPQLKEFLAACGIDVSPLTAAAIGSLDWDKMSGLLPAAVQDAASGRLLMLGYMNREALAATLDSGFATFFSRSKDRLWQKGETSGNRLAVLGVHEDCDGDALLVLAEPEGPTCHEGTPSCFGGEPIGPGWLAELAAVVADRAKAGPDTSYTRWLLKEGTERIAQKVGEEGVEVALAAVTRDPGGMAEEIADLLFHLTVLLQARGTDWTAVTDVLRRRHRS